MVRDAYLFAHTKEIMTSYRHRFSLLRLTATASLSVLLLGCAVGPDYRKPDTWLPKAWTLTQDSQGASDRRAIEQNWWRNFHDPVLNQLIEKAAASNLDLKIAQAQISEARALRDVAVAALMPTGDMMGGAIRQANQIGFPSGGGGPSDLSSLVKQPFNVFKAGFDASWELDLFGGHRREAESAAADLDAATVARDALLISTLAEVARTYVDVRLYQAQLNIAQEALASDQKTTALTRQRVEAGNSAGIDVLSAEAQEKHDQGQIPYFNNQLAQAEYALDILLGAPPGAAHGAVAAISSVIAPALPYYRPSLALKDGVNAANPPGAVAAISKDGVNAANPPGAGAAKKVAPIPVADHQLILAAPAAVIAQRPDIRNAERKLASATAQQGVAVAKFFPDVSLTGFIGLFNTNAGNFLSVSSKSWTMGGNVLWPILSYGSLSANLDGANAKQQEAMTRYQKSILAALSDVERTYTAYAEQEKYRQMQEKSAAADAHISVVALERYREGLTSMLEVLDAQRRRYASQNQLTLAQAQTAQNLIAVYKSLGGGWKDGR
jgi:multidrug efflux system outer membrane protein